MKKFISVFVSIVMVTSLLITGSSAQGYAEPQENRNRITEFCFTVYDKDGNIVQEGKISETDERIQWNGIVLDNGNTLKLTKSDGNAFSMLGGARYDYVINLDRKATLRHIIYMSNYDTSRVMEVVEDFTSTLANHARAATMPQTAWYYFTITNYSSDPVTLKHVELIF